MSVKWETPKPRDSNPWVLGPNAIVSIPCIHADQASFFAVAIISSTVVTAPAQMLSAAP